MYLDTELNEAFEEELRDGSHSSETVDLMFLHLEQRLVGIIDHRGEAVTFAAATEKEDKQLNDRAIENKNVVHEKHEDQENWEDGGPWDAEHENVVRLLVSPDDSIQQELDHLNWADE